MGQHQRSDLPSDDFNPLVKRKLGLCKTFGIHLDFANFLKSYDGKAPGYD